MANKDTVDWIFHDIAHCANKNCERRHNCQRWIAHLDAVDKELIVTYCAFDEKNCDSYMEFTKDSIKKQVDVYEQLCKLFGTKI